MTEYIDREALIDRIKQEPTDGMFTDEILEAIAEIPAPMLPRWCMGGGYVLKRTKNNSFCVIVARKESIGRATTAPTAVQRWTEAMMNNNEDPCETCLRWGECNGVDAECPLQQTMENQTK